MNSTLVRNCLLEIKQQLKRKGIAYADIAERMELSEITVKRMLNQDDISVGRLTVLAEAAGFSMSKLIGIAEAKLPEVKCFTAHQDEAFVRHPHLFQYFMKLQEHDRSPETVARLFNLDDLSTYLYLRKLEDLGLIELHEAIKMRRPICRYCSYQQNTVKNSCRTLKKCSCGSLIATVTRTGEIYGQGTSGSWSRLAMR